MLALFPNLERLLLLNRWIWFARNYVIPNSERKNRKLGLYLEDLEKEMIDEVDFYPCS